MNFLTLFSCKSPRFPGMHARKFIEARACPVIVSKSKGIRRKPTKELTALYTRLPADAFLSCDAHRACPPCGRTYPATSLQASCGCHVDIPLICHPRAHHTHRWYREYDIRQDVCHTVTRYARP